MESIRLINLIISDLDDLQVNLGRLASSMEFDGKRKDYLQYLQQINALSDKMRSDLRYVDDQERYTGILDRI